MQTETDPPYGIDIILIRPDRLQFVAQIADMHI